MVILLLLFTSKISVKRIDFFCISKVLYFLATYRLFYSIKFLTDKILQKYSVKSAFGISELGDIGNPWQCC